MHITQFMTQVALALRHSVFHDIEEVETLDDGRIKVTVNPAFEDKKIFTLEISEWEFSEKPKMIPVLDDFDWREVFEYAYPDAVISEPDTGANQFIREDVKEIYGLVEGENDGDSWIMYGRLWDDRFFFIEASCDYTGWDCQAGGSSRVSTTLDALVRFGIGNAERSRLGIYLNEEA